jgi:hypothetical protein
MPQVNNNDDSGRRASVPGQGFTDSLWGSKARALVTSTYKLQELNWTQIQENSAIQMIGEKEKAHESREAAADAMSLHAQIEIDW